MLYIHYDISDQDMKFVADFLLISVTYSTNIFCSSSLSSVCMILYNTTLVDNKGLQGLSGRESVCKLALFSNNGTQVPSNILNLESAKGKDKTLKGGDRN